MWLQCFWTTANKPKAFLSLLTKKEPPLDCFSLTSERNSRPKQLRHLNFETSAAQWNSAQLVAQQLKGEGNPGLFQRCLNIYCPTAWTSLLPSEYPTESLLKFKTTPLMWPRHNCTTGLQWRLQLSSPYKKTSYNIRLLKVWFVHLCSANGIHEFIFDSAG